MDIWIHENPNGVNRVKLRRPSKHHQSIYRYDRKFGHKTIKGKGLIAKLRKAGK